MDSTTSSETTTKSSSFRVNTRYEILTPSGFKPFTGIQQTIKPALRLTLDDGSTITATGDHRFRTPEGWAFVRTCKPGDVLVGSDNNQFIVVSIEDAGVQPVYDPVNVADGAEYISGPVVSHNCSFLTTAYTLIEGKVLSTLTHEEPVYTEEGGKYQEFISPVKYDPEKPDKTPQRNYIILIDVGHGEDKDASTFHIIDITALPYKVCATYRNATISTMSFPATIMRYAKKYEQFINGTMELPFLMVEAMDVGRDVAYILNREYSYPNMLATEMVGKHGQVLKFGINERRHPGLRMSAGAKKSAGAVLKTLIENQQIRLNDLRVIQELSTFVRRGATYEADHGHHDDMVTPLMILAWITLQPSFSEITANRSLETYIKQAVESVEGDTIEVSYEQPLPFAAVNGGGWGHQVPGEYIDDDDPNWLLA